MSTFTNNLGQEINPGDKVVAIAQGYSHAIKERAGTYVGLSAAGSPQVRVTVVSYGYFRPDGTRGKRSDPDTKYAGKPVERVSTYYAGRVYKLA